MPCHGIKIELQPDFAAEPGEEMFILGARDFLSAFRMTFDLSAGVFELGPSGSLGQ